MIVVAMNVNWDDEMAIPLPWTSSWIGREEDLLTSEADVAVVQQQYHNNSCDEASLTTNLTWHSCE
jgi:hypothetical protein